MKRSEIENEIRQIKSARPTQSKVFADRRANRLHDLENLLVSAKEESAPADPRVEALLRTVKGGDRFGR